MRQPARSRAAIWPGATVPALRSRRLTWRWPDLAGWAALEIGRRRLFLLTPICLGIGILLYFAADGEPSLSASVFGMLVLAGLLWPARRSFLLRIVITGGLLVLAGFGAATLRTKLVEAPRIGFAQFADVEGVVETVEVMGERVRLLVRVERYGARAVPEQAAPALVRVSLTQEIGKAPRAGDRIAFSARLLPPAAPALPGGYDFEREAFFLRIGAVGSVVGTPRLTRLDAPTLMQRIDRARNDLTERIQSVICGQAGALSAALITGKRGGLSEDSNNALRAAGIYHIVSISGLHMVLVAGVIFFFVRAGLALSPVMALRLPGKKIAALASLIGTAVYCVFSGSEVATLRSLIMIAVMLGAIIIDRPALSMRNVAISACMILLLEPETLLGPSFQMSFAAVAALIAANESWQMRKRAKDDIRAEQRMPGRIFAHAGRLAFGLLATTMVATLATAPFGIEHFQKVNSYGLIGNVLAVPLVSFVVMPSAVLGVLLYPFGLDRVVWMLMGAANERVLAAAHWIEAFPRASLAMPASNTGFALLVLALLMNTIPLGRARLAAFAPALLGGLAMLHAQPPDLIVSADGASVLYRMLSGEAAILGKPIGDFAENQWLAATGTAKTAKRDPTIDNACDPAGCVLVLPRGTVVSVVKDAAAFEADCRRADILITRLAAPGWCKPRAFLLDRNALRQSGAVSITETSPGLSKSATYSSSAPRPWRAIRQ